MLLLIALIVGILFLPSPWSWVLIGVAAMVELAEVTFWLWWRRKRIEVRAGAETLIGRSAVVVSPCLPDGQVRLDGEIWKARCKEETREGDEVTVVDRDRLTLIVERVAGG